MVGTGWFSVTDRQIYHRGLSENVEQLVVIGLAKGGEGRLRTQYLSSVGRTFKKPVAY